MFVVAIIVHTTDILLSSLSIEIVTLLLLQASDGPSLGIGG